ncbi:MAG: hypothetical protein FWD92_05170 [Methanomassiliicoccaceae archaeon]|nr:hypothetical protein [Methanomassiliicoccaceae archaeon]
MTCLNDKILTLVAVAVTAVLCISVTYILLDGDAQKQTIRVTVSDDVPIEDMILFFTEFENNANAVIQMTADDTAFTADHVRSLLLNGVADAVVSGKNTDLTNSEGITTIEFDDFFISFRSDAQGIVNFFKNWLHSQSFI